MLRLQFVFQLGHLLLSRLPVRVRLLQVSLFELQRLLQTAHDSDFVKSAQRHLL